MEAVRSSETSANFNRTTLHRIAVDITVHNHLYDHTQREDKVLLVQHLTSNLASAKSDIGHPLLFKWSQFMAYLLDTSCSSSGRNSRFACWTSLTHVVSFLGSCIGHSLLVMWLQSSVRVLDTLYSSCGCNPRFVYWTLFTRHVAAILGSYIGHSLLVMWLQSSVRVLATLYSSYSCNPRFLYWTLFTHHVVAVLGSYIQWRNVALSLSGSNYDRHHSTRYLWLQPSPAPLTVLLYTQGRFYESSRFAWFSFCVSSHRIERIYRSVSVYILHSYLSVPPSQSL
jgi:hypothetical protein